MSVSQFRYAFVLSRAMLCKQMHLSARNFKNYLSFYKRIYEYQHSFFSKDFRTTGMQIKALFVCEADQNITSLAFNRS